MIRLPDTLRFLRGLTPGSGVSRDELNSTPPVGSPCALHGCMLGRGEEAWLQSRLFNADTRARLSISSLGRLVADRVNDRDLRFAVILGLVRRNRDHDAFLIALLRSEHGAVCAIEDVGSAAKFVFVITDHLFLRVRGYKYGSHRRTGGQGNPHAAFASCGAGIDVGAQDRKSV